MKQLLLIASMIIWGSPVIFAQRYIQDSLSSKKVHYFFRVQSGSLMGCSSCANGKEITFSGATMTGIKFARKWRAGLGIGFDSYFQWNTIPIYGHISYDFLGKQNALFAEINYGMALATWRTMQFPEYGYQESKGSRMYSFGIGYRLNYEKNSISMGIGRKTQLFTMYYEYPTYYWDANGIAQGDPTRRTVKSELNRIMIWIAVGFN